MDFYGKVSLTTSSHKNLLKESQRNWLVTRRNPCKDDTRCLKREYLYRLLELQNPTQNSVSGSYERYDWGKPSLHPSDLDILQLNDHEIYVYGIALWIIDAKLGIIHVGEIDGIYPLADHRVNYQDDNGCSLTITFGTNNPVVSDSSDPDGGWGVHVTFYGQYQKTE